MAVKHNRVITDAEAASAVQEIGKTEWNDDHIIDNDTITTAMVQSGAVTYARIQNVSVTDRILGRDSAGAGPVEEITPAALRTMINVADGANNYIHPNHTGDVTSVGDGTQTITNDAVMYAKMQNVSVTDRLLGRQTAGAGDVEEIPCTAAGRALIDDASAADQRTTLGLAALAIKSTVATADIDNNAVDNSKLRDSAAVSVIGRSANSTGDPADIEASADGQYVGRRADAVGFFSLQASDLPSHTHVKANITDFAHQSTHQSAGSDALSGLMDATARVAVRKNTGGADVGARRRLNFIEGSGATLTIADDSANEEIDVTIALSAGGTGTLSDVKEGGTLVSDNRNNLDFNANDFNITDDAGANDADIAINRNVANGIAGLDASGDLAKTEQHPQTAYRDEANDFGPSVQTFDNIEVDDTDGTPVADRRIACIDGLLRSRDTSNIEGRHISKASLELITDSEVAGGAAIAKSKISTSGTWAAADIPGLDASKIITGEFTKSQVSDTGTWNAAEIPNLDASKITSGTIATARLGSGTADSSTFLRGDQTYATPSGTADSTAQIPTAATLTAWQTAIDNAGPRGKVRGAKALDVTIAVNSFLRIWSDAGAQIDNDGVHLDAQRARFTAASGAWTGDKDLIDLGLNTGNTSTELTLEHFYVNCNRQKVSGIGNKRDFDTIANSKIKFSRISDCVIENVGFDDGTTTGVYYGIRLYHGENVVVIEHCHIDGIQGWSAANHGVGIMIINTANNAGNCRVIFCLVGSPGGQNGTTGVEFAQETANVINRIFILWNHIFMGSADNSRAVYGHVAHNGPDGSRTFHIFGNTLEDVHIGIELLGVNGAGGISLAWIESNFIEMKNGFRSTSALLKIGANCEAFVNFNSFYGRTDAAGDILNTWVMDTNVRICVFTHNVLKNRKQDGSTGLGTWNKLSGSGTANWRGRDNIGFKTESNVISADQSASAASGDKSVAINHDLDITPNIQDCVPFFTDGTTPVAANSAWRAQVMRIVSVSSTQVTIRWHQTAAGAAGEQIKVGCQTGTRLPAAT